MKNWIKNITNWYKERDCKYYVLKIEDIAKACDNYSDFLQFQIYLDKYNKYRKELGKPVNRYFVLNRDEFPRFNDFKGFNEVVELLK